MTAPAEPTNSDESAEEVPDNHHATLCHRILRLPATVMIGMIRGWQLFLSPLFGRTCRFHPSCSQYTILAIRKYGCLKGGLKGACRICRCHPWNPGGYDPP